MPDRIERIGATRLAYLVAALAAFLTFSNSLGNFFLMDDFWHLHKISSMDLGDWWKPWSFSAKDNESYWMAMHKIRGVRESSFFFRPLVTLAFVLSDKLGSGQAWVFHLSNVLLHVGTTVVFLAIARILIGRNLASFGAALVFAAHPAHCESVQWICANGDLLAGLFFGIAFLGHIRARTAPCGNDWRWAALGAVGFILALCSKEMAIMFPAVALFYDLLFYRPGVRQSENQTRISLLNPQPFWKTRSFYLVLGVYALIAALYLGNRISVIRGVADLNVGGNYMADWRAPGFFSAILVNLATYLWHFWTFFPLMPLDTREAWQDAPWLVVPVWGALIAFYLWLGTKFSNKKQYQFFWWWQVLTVLPALPILMSQRVLYIPSIGFCLLVGLLLKEHWVACMQRRGRGWWLFPAAVGVCFLTTFAMNTMWSRPSLIIRDHIAQIREALPNPQKESRIYLVDIWPPSYGLEEGLRRAYGRRDLDIQILSFSPKILEYSEPSWDRPLEKLFAAFFPEACSPLKTRHELRPGKLHLELEGDVYFKGLVEGLLPVEPRLGSDLQVIDTERFKVVLTPNDAGNATAADFYFADDGQKSYFLALKDGRYRPMPGN